MNTDLENTYSRIRSGGTGFYTQKRGLIAVWGGEAVQFLDGLISNDVKTLEDGQQMLAAFPNAQGRLLAVVRVLRQGERFLFETEEATRTKVFQNLFRFTFAGDFFVEDISDKYRYIEVWGADSIETFGSPGGFQFTSAKSRDRFLPLDHAGHFSDRLSELGSVEIPDELYEVLRIEAGTPRYGLDMDETTIVPELGLDALISYNKGCYIGQEIIARIHFRGHVAKRLTGIVLSGPPTAAIGLISEPKNLDLTTLDGKSAGRVTSTTFSPALNTDIALAYVRYEHLADGTELNLGEVKGLVKPLPFVI
jgi:folate-binding protein YgfZ